MSQVWASGLMAVRCLRVNVQMLNSVVDLPCEPTDSVSETPLVRTRVSSCPFELSSASISSPPRAGRPCRSLLSPRSTAADKGAPAVCESAPSFAATGKGGANPVATCSDAAIATNGMKVRSALPAPQSCGWRAWGIVLLSADVTSSYGRIDCLGGKGAEISISFSESAMKRLLKRKPTLQRVFRRASWGSERGRRCTEIQLSKSILFQDKTEASGCEDTCSPAGGAGGSDQ